MGHKAQKGSILIISAIIFLVISIVLFTSLQDSIMNQKIVVDRVASIIAFKNAEAGILAEIAKLNGETMDLSFLPGSITHALESNVVDGCQQHTAVVTSSAQYGHSITYLKAAYSLAPQTPIPGCAANISHWLWWRQLDS